MNVFQGFFGPKMAVFGPKLQVLKLRSATCESRSRPPPLSFSLKLCVIVVHTHRYHPPTFHLNLKHHDGSLIFAYFARAACCLLAAAAKPGRSTLDTKKGYKTKTGSTSSVTLALTLTLTLTAVVQSKSQTQMLFSGMSYAPFTAVDRQTQEIVCWSAMPKPYIFQLTRGTRLCRPLARIKRDHAK